MKIKVLKEAVKNGKIITIVRTTFPKLNKHIKYEVKVYDIETGHKGTYLQPDTLAEAIKEYNFTLELA